MARLILEDGFEMDLKLKLGIQSPDTGIIITLWKNNKPYFVPKQNSEYCDPEDSVNYRFMDFEYLGTDDFLPSLISFVNEIQADDSEHIFHFDCWPEDRITLFFTKQNKSKIIDVRFIYYKNLDGLVQFEKCEKFTGEFNFKSTMENLIKFSEQLFSEFQMEIKPKRIILKESEADDEPWDEEKEIIKKQKYIESEKPIILIDACLLDHRHTNKDVKEFKKCISNLQAVYKVAIIGLEKENHNYGENKEFLNGLKGIVFLEKNCYPKNSELIYLRENWPRENVLSVYCCLDRAVTSIWFDYYCKSSWNEAYKVIIECAENLIDFTDLKDDDGTCGYVI